MKNLPGLVRRGSTYYVRLKVPRHLVTVLKRRELKRSLATKDLREAKRAYHRAVVQLRGAINEAEDRLTRKNSGPIAVPQDVLESAVRDWFFQLWDRCQAGLLAPPKAGAPAYEDMIQQAEIELDALSKPDEELHGTLLFMGQQMLAKRGYGAARATDVETLAAYIRRGMALVNGAVIDQYRNNRFHHEPADPLFRRNGDAGSSPAHRAPESLTIEQVIGKFNTDPQRENLAPKNRLGYLVPFRLLAEVAGEKTAIASVSRQHAREIQSILAKLPPNATKRFRDKTLPQVAELARRQGLRPIEATTAENILGNLSAFFSWAVREEYATRNPFEGLQPLQEEKSDDEKRKPYDEATLVRIFSSPLFTEEQVRKEYPGRYWVPLIALFHGARSNEVCQIEVADVGEEQGIPVFRIKKETDSAQIKRVKNAHSKRVLPIHPKLIALGFLEFVKQQRERGETVLFPDVRVAATGYRSDNFSKWYARFQRGAGVTDRRLAFHSFRHSFRDAARAANIPAEIVSELGGWSKGKSERDNYGEGHSMSRRLQELSKISYACVERILLPTAAQSSSKPRRGATAPA